MQKFLQIFKVADIRKKIFIVFGFLILFRLLAAIPIAGIDANQLKEFLAQSQLLGFFNIISGGGLSNLSIMMLGVGPYITATIIMQLLTMIFPAMKQMYYEEGAMGRAKMNRISRFLTVPLSLLQGYAFLNLLASQGVLPQLGGLALVQNLLLITAGSIVLMWIGELITEQKVGNGISLIIFSGIVVGLPQLLQQLYLQYTPELLTTYIAFALLSVLIIASIVFISEGEHKIPVTYAKRIRGNRVYGGNTSYLPLKVNQAGVIPIIFAISLLLFPQFAAQMISLISPELSLTLQGYVNTFLGNLPVYTTLYFFLVVIFTYFYTSITFNPEEISKNLQQSGGFIPGIRPGSPTSDFLKSTTGKITLFGAVFLGIIAVLPNVLQGFTGIQIGLGGTTILIVVSVALEVTRQINSQLVIREYDSIQ